MSNFQISSLRNSSVWGLYRLRDKVEMDPDYQREGDIWNREKKQLLIDTIVNLFDVPKIYLHKFPEPIEKEGKFLEYAVIDGKQRLKSIWGFIDGDFDLSKDFTFIRDESAGNKIDAAGLSYQELGRNYPDVKTDFDSYALDVVCIETDDPELIEELFSRLNEAVPLSAAEKRNATPGPLSSAVRNLVEHPFFAQCLPFSNKRYRHYDLAAKMLYVAARDGIVDTKKTKLDQFFAEGRKLEDRPVNEFYVNVTHVINIMRSVFDDRDIMLKQLGMVMLYFYLFRRARRDGLVNLVTRDALSLFDEKRKRNREIAQEDISAAEYALLEFDRHSQSLNDAYAMKIRLSILDDTMFGGALQFAEIGEPVIGE